ncbi:MAG TPA: hypothetical protein VNA20_05520 [Frankiaceae bacterium]|nr:hypothetical protein [Frankiaceae bacterium]
MEIEVPRTWLRLRFALRADGSMRADASDHTGRSARAPRAGHATPVGWRRVRVPSGRWPPFDVVFPSVAAEWLVESLREVPQTRRGPHRGGRVAVPVFVTPPLELRYLDWESVVPRLFGAKLASRVAVVIDRNEPSAPPFELPLRVVAVGDRGNDVVRALRRGRVWLGVAPDVQPHAAVVDWVEDDRDAAAQIVEGAADVLVLDGWQAAALAARRLPRGAVRLAVVLGVDPGVGLALSAPGLPVARSVMTIGGPPDTAQIATTGVLFDAISHDQPLHEAAAQMTLRGRAVRLEASPASVHDLRLADAWNGLVQRAYRLSGSIGAGDLESVGIQMSGSELLEAVRDMHALTVDFGRESRGLHPLAQTSARLSRADAIMRDVTFAYRPEDAATTLPRVVNIGLRREASAWEPGANGVYLARDESLAAGAEYDLDVQIGAQWPTTLVVGERQPIDLLLPDYRAGHHLDVVVFGADVEVLSEAVQSVELPPVGASDLLTFRVRMPARPSAVQLRVSVFHENHLVQTFRLSGLVEERPRHHDGDAVSARLEHSATERWDNIDALPARALSLTLNRAAGGTHRLFLKQGDAASVLDLAPDLQNDYTTAVREVLAGAMTGAIPGTEAMWQLAQHGAEIARGLFGRLDDAGARAAAGVRAGEDLLIQVVRADPHYALPWALLYDWDLPEVVYGAPPPPVCFGRDDAGHPCTHTADAGEVCARGFWGIRHQVEELLADASGRDTAGPIPARTPTVAVGRGVDDEAALAFPAALGQRLGAGAVQELQPADSLLDLLFDGGTRPPVIVVIGHHETRDLVGEPVGSRIQSGTAERWLIDRNLVDRARREGRWAPPQPIVLLMSCGSALVRPRDMTSFLTALNGAGAAAVVGTECDVYSDAAAAFAGALLGAMASIQDTRLPFGRAVRLARHTLVTKERDVRGFAFTAFGSADLELAPA